MTIKLHELFGLQDRVAIVSGAGSGIGREIARFLGCAGVVAERSLRQPDDRRADRPH